MTVILATRRPAAAALSCLALACSGLLAGASPAAARTAARSLPPDAGGAARLAVTGAKDQKCDRTCNPRAARGRDQPSAPFALMVSNKPRRQVRTVG